jgi:SpoVK/Ycf46/Vps4 family AAA+-type ATPase
MPTVPKFDFVDNIRSLIVSNAGHDQVAFRRSAEAIIRDLSVSNRPGEAKMLRDALQTQPANGTNGALTSLAKQPQGLISFSSRLGSAQLFFMPETQAALNRILDECRAARQLAEGGLRPRTRLLFWGPPGCGKTAAAHWLASELSLQCGIVRLGSLITSFVGETGANLQKVLSMAEQTPMVLLLDEADAIAKARDDANDVGELRRVVNSLLQGLDGVAGQRSLIILASNHSHLFDPAIWRRFDDVIEFPIPAPEERLAQLKHLTNGLRLRGSLQNAAKEMAGFSFSEIERAVNDVAKTMILQGCEAVETISIVKEGKRWRRKMQAAAGSSTKRR